MDVHGKYGQGLRGGFRHPQGVKSHFYIMHPAVSFLYYVCAFCLIFFFYHPLFLGSALLFAIGLSLFYSGLERTKKALFTSILIGLAMLIVNPLINHRGNTILFYLFEKPITLEASLYGVQSFLLIVTMLLLLSSLNVLIDSERFLFLFSGMLPRTAFIVNMALRYIPLLKRRAMELKEISELDGAGMTRKTIASRIKNAGILLNAFTEATLENGMAIAQTLKSKHYGRGKRTFYRIYHLTPADDAVLAILGSMFLSLTVIKWLGAGAYSFYPHSDPLVISGITIPAYLLFLLIFCIPFFIEAITYLRTSTKAGVSLE